MDRFYYPNLNMILSDRRVATTRREKDDNRRIIFLAKPKYKLLINDEEVTSGRVNVYEGKHQRDGREQLGGIDAHEPWTQSETMTIQELLEKRNQHIKEKGKRVPFEDADLIEPATFQAAIWVDSATFNNLIQADPEKDVIHLGLELDTKDEKAVEVIHWMSTVVWDGAKERNIWAKSFDLVIHTPDGTQPKEEDSESDEPKQASETSVLIERVAQLESQLIPRVAGLEKTLLWIFGVLVAIGILIWVKR